jgi:hypothetical protein
MNDHMTCKVKCRLFGAALIAALAALTHPVAAQVPSEIAEPDATIVAIYHAEGAQVYECMAASDGKLSWSFREPIATLLSNGLTVGRHYAGPHWQLTDGSTLGGKAVGRAPGKTASDIPWLKLTVTDRHGDGKFATVDVIQRINTKGGVAAGPCDDAGQFLSVPYSADYAFLHKD